MSKNEVLRKLEARRTQAMVVGGVVGAAAGTGVGVAWASKSPEHAELKVAGSALVGGLLGVLLASKLTT
jgi:hypothetical protein